MWGIASISFGSTYTKNDYLGKSCWSPVPRGVGCIRVVRHPWALLFLLVLVPPVWVGGTLAMGFASPVGRSWVGIPGHWGVVFVCRNGRFAVVELLGLLLGVSPLGGLARG